MGIWELLIEHRYFVHTPDVALVYVIILIVCSRYPCIMGEDNDVGKF